MGKKILKCTGITALMLAFLPGAAYMGLARYYKGGFSYGTWINGIYCTGKTVEEVNEVLLSDCSYDGLCIRDREGNSWRLVAEGCYVELPLTDDMKAELSRWEKVKDFQECGIIYQFGGAGSGGCIGSMRLDCPG